MKEIGLSEKAVVIEENRKKAKMDISLLILIAIVLAFMAVAFHTQGRDGMSRGFGVGWKLIESVGARLLLGFVLAGFMQVVIPAQYVLKWIGRDSGMSGVFIGSFAGSLMPGGPYVMFPIIGSLFEQGAAVGPLLALVTAWSVTSFNRLLVWELPMLGARVALLRFGISILFPLLVGFVSNLAFYRGVR